MLIELHAIQNHSPANLNRDDLGAPKTCYFGGVLRSRISSQCIKRSIRKSEEFKLLCGGIRTRRLPQYLAEQIKTKHMLELAKDIVQRCGLLHDEEKGKSKDVIVFLTKAATAQMVRTLQEAPEKPSETQLRDIARQFAELVAKERHAPDMALSGRMLEPAKAAKEYWKGLDSTIEAALQVGHAISTHVALPEVDYFVAADDVPGEDAGGAHIGEAMFASACFYKYFSINWESLVANLQGNVDLAAHTVGAFIRGAALVNPTGKQNSFAAHNPPDGMLVEIKNSPVSYANAFAKPASQDERDIISQSIAQLGQYIYDIDTGYGRPQHRFWFSPNLRHSLAAQVVEEKDGKNNQREFALTENNVKSLEELIRATLGSIGCDWDEVQKVTVDTEVA